MIHLTHFDSGAPGAACVAFGAFDGMHIGHMAIIKRLCAYPGQKPVLLSFAEETRPVICTEKEKAYLLKDSGVAVMISAPAREMMALDAQTFARDILAGKLHAKTVVVGEGARFGTDQQNIAAFAELGKQYGFKVETVPATCIKGTAVSTGAVKAAIHDMDYPRMQALLGHPFVMQGVVVHGKAAGRKFGMPTANLGVAPNKIFPPHGVYGSFSHIENDTYRGMTNVGLRPSDDDIPIATVETFILNFDRDIYDKEVMLELLVYIRGVVKFPGGLAELRRQIDKDIEQVRAYMTSLPPEGQKPNP